MMKTCPISSQRIDKNATRIASLFNIIILALFFSLDQAWLLYLLAADFGLKAIQTSKSPLSRLAKLLVDSLPLKPVIIDALPKQFALRLGFVVLLLASLLNVLGFYDVAKVFVAIFLVLTFLEFAIGFCIGCYMYTFYLAMAASNKSGFYLRLGLFILSFALLFILIKTLLYNYAVSSTQTEIENILRTQLATRNYINNEQKNLIRSLKERKLINPELYEPTLMSSSYITHSIHENYNAIRKQNGEKALKLKIASRNPLNVKSQANEFENELIERFNKSDEISYRDIQRINGEEYLYVALATEKITQECLQCHGDPKDAPFNLRKIYGGVSGFGLKVGERPAIISIYAPLDTALEDSDKLMMTIFFGMLAVFFMIFVILESFVKSLKKRESYAKELHAITQAQKRDLEKLNKKLQAESKE